MSLLCRCAQPSVLYVDLGYIIKKYGSFNYFFISYLAYNINVISAFLSSCNNESSTLTMLFLILTVESCTIVTLF